MAAAQTKGHEEDKHTGMQGKNNLRKKRKRKTESRKQGTKVSKQENRTQGVSIATNFPVSATKPRRGPCHTICHLLPALVGNGIKCHCCRCRAPPPANKSTKTKQNWLDSGAVATQVPLIISRTCPHVFRVRHLEIHNIRLETSKPFFGENRFLIGHGAIRPHRLAAVVRYGMYLQK